MRTQEAILANELPTHQLQEGELCSLLEFHFVGRGMQIWGPEKMAQSGGSEPGLSLGLPP